MANITTPIPNVVARKKSVQDHIDELPVWADGTKLPSAPMTGMQWLIWSLAAAGKFFEGYVVFMTGVALPLFSRQFQMGAFEHGVIGAASLFGILIGAVTLGGLSDRFGRKPMFVAEMIIFVAFLAALCFATNYIQVVIFLFGLGFGLGCDYPTAHMIISENIPSSKRGKLVLGAFAFQAVGALAGTAVGFFVLSVLPELSAWRWMFASAIIPAVLVTLGRCSAAAVEICSWRRSQHFPKDLAARFIPQRYDSSPAGIGGSRGQGVARIDRERVPVDRDRVDVGRRAGRWIGKPPFVPGPGRRVPVGVKVLIDGPRIGKPVSYLFRALRAATSRPTASSAASRGRVARPGPWSKRRRRAEGSGPWRPPAWPYSPRRRRRGRSRPACCRRMRLCRPSLARCRPFRLGTRPRRPSPPRPPPSRPSSPCRPSGSASARGDPAPCRAGRPAASNRGSRCSGRS